MGRRAKSSIQQKWYYYISDDGVTALKNYKYSATGSSPLTDAMTPFWNYTAELLPMWLAPNVVTVASALSVVVSFLLCAVACPGMQCSSDRWWVHVVSGVCLFLYQLFDNLDGKQARRTGASSPLGELFDHGLDAIVMGLSVIPLACAVPIGRWVVLLMVLSTMASFYACHWEAYHTHVTNFSALCPVVEAQFFTIAAEFISAFVGQWFWNIKIVFTFAGMWWWIGAIFPLLGVVQSVVTVLSTAGRNSFFSFLALAPFVTFASLTVFWFSSSPDLLEESPFLMFAVCSLVFAYIQQRLLVQHLSKEPMHWSYPILGAYACLVAKARFAPNALLSTTTSAWIMLVICVAQEMVFGCSVIWQMTGFLGIRAFVITPKKNNSNLKASDNIHTTIKKEDTRSESWVERRKVLCEQ